MCNFKLLDTYFLLSFFNAAKISLVIHVQRTGCKMVAYVTAQDQCLAYYSRYIWPKEVQNRAPNHSYILSL